MELKDQLSQVQTQLAEEKAKGGARDINLVSSLEAQEAQLLSDIMVEKQKKLASVGTMPLTDLKAWESELLNSDAIDTDALKAVQDQIAALEQAQAHEERVQQVATDYYSVIDNLDLGDGVTLRKLIPNPVLYQLATIGLKNAFAAQVEPISKQIAELQSINGDQAKSNDDLRTKLAKLADENADLNNKLSTEILNRQQAELYRDNAAAQLDEAKQEISRLNQKVDEQRQELALGVRDQIKVVNTAEEEKQKAEALAEYKRQYTVYGEQPADFKRSKFTAKRAYDDSVVEYTNLEKPSYTVIDEAQVTQFRSQYPAPVQNENHANSTLDQPVQEAPSITPPPMPEVPQFPQEETTAAGFGLANEKPGVPDAGATVEERLASLEKSNLDMQTWIDSIEKRVGAIDGKQQYVA